MARRGKIAGKPITEDWDGAAVARAFAAEAAPQWSHADLAMLRHQLGAELDYDLFHDPALRDVPEHPRIRTFWDLFTDPAPPVELLEAVKLFAKGSVRSTERPLPTGVATVLYYLAILVAAERCKASITTLDAAAVRAGRAWVLGQGWVPAEVRELVAGLGG